MSKALTLSVPARGDQLSTISDFVTKAARDAGFDERATYHVQMAVDEACANVIYHAYAYEGQGVIELCCERNHHDFVVTITDHGQPFDPSEVPPPDISAALSDRREGGLGLYLMQRLMDEVTHQFTPHANVLTMVKHLPAP